MDDNYDELTPEPLNVGDQFHVRVPTTIRTADTFGSAHVFPRGATLTVSEELVRANTNARGQSWISIIHDTDAQIAKWGEVRFGVGPFPADAETWGQPGDRDWHDQRAAARDAAHALISPAERAAALAEVQRRFGPLATSTSTEIRNVGQRRALAEDAARRATQRRGIITSHVE